MIYILAVFLPPLGLLLNGQPFSAIFNLILIPICLLLGLIFPVLWLIPSLHAVIGAVPYQARGANGPSEAGFSASCDARWGRVGQRRGETPR